MPTWEGASRPLGKRYGLGVLEATGDHAPLRARKGTTIGIDTHSNNGNLSHACYLLERNGDASIVGKRTQDRCRASRSGP